MKSGSRPPIQSTRLLDQLRERIRYFHYSLKTEKAYVYWVRRYIRFHGLKHPREMGPVEVQSDIRRVQELLGHSDVRTTMIYTHVLASSAAGTASPLESLPDLKITGEFANGYPGIREEIIAYSVPVEIAAP